MRHGDFLKVLQQKRVHNDLSAYLEIMFSVLTSLGYQVVPESYTAKDVAVLICIDCKPKVADFKIQQRILIQHECINIAPQMWTKSTADIFTKVITFNKLLLQQRGVDPKKLIFQLLPRSGTFDSKQFHSEKNKFCCLIASNKKITGQNEAYSLRERIVDSQISDLDVYGHDWDRKIFKYQPLRFFSRRVKIKYRRENWRGTPDNKFAVGSRYRFQLAIENTVGFEGYVTEKIFDCMKAGSIPIYLGPKNINDCVPSDTFININDFSHWRNALDYAKNMPDKDAKAIQENIKGFLTNLENTDFGLRLFSNVLESAL